MSSLYNNRTYLLMFQCWNPSVRGRYGFQSGVMDMAVGQDCYKLFNYTMRHFCIGGFYPFAFDIDFVVGRLKKFPYARLDHGSCP